jgi:predicted metal-dependent hydrolase
MTIKIHKLLRSARRSISLEITRDGRLVVRMPRYGSVTDVKRFIFQKQDWIEKKMTEASLQSKKNAPRRFVPGEQFYYLGEKYPLQLAEVHHPKLKFQNGFFMAESNLKYGRKIFIDWYKRQAKLNISKRLRWYASMHQLKVHQIRITSASRRWGSCTSQGNINFTWKLILLPLKIMDYVVVHELAHLVHHNHSKSFWAEVGKMLPDYKERRRWLKKNGELYSL